MHFDGDLLPGPFRVTGYATVLAGQAVTFTTSVGTLAQTSVITNDQGLARTILTAPAGNAQVTARAGSIETTPLVVAVQPLVTPPTPEPNPPSPNPHPNPARRGPRPKRGQTDQVQLSQHSLRLVPVVGAPGGRTSSLPA